jgi:hypothetical protein
MKKNQGFPKNIEEKSLIECFLLKNYEYHHILIVNPSL